MMKVLRISKIFTFAVVAICYLFISNQAQAHTTENNHSETVVLSNNGFSPETVTIKKGSTIIWKIEGKGEHWPASNFHPTHEEYPGASGCIGSKLDACRGLKEGESFKFTFDKTGTWGIHDHNYPAYTMTVKVTGEKDKEEVKRKQDKSEKNILQKFIESFSAKKVLPKEAAQNAKKHCKNTETKGRGIFKCYAAEFSNISYNHGIEFATKSLTELQKIDPESKNCHFIAHGIGWGSYKKDPGNWQEAISKSSSICSYGEQMGIIEQYVQNLPDGKLNKKDVANICGQAPQADCNHAVGHMMLLYAKNDFNKANALCSAITDREQRFICYHGMFMERFVGGNLIEHGILPKSMSNWPTRLPQDIEFCKNFNGDLEHACWREIVHPAYFYYKKDAQAIFNLCNSAPDKKEAFTCKSHAVPELAGGEKHNFKITKPICELEKDSNFRKNCYLTLVSLKMNFLSLEDSKDVVKFCASLEKKYQASCFGNIGRHIDVNVSKSEKESFCNQTPNEFKKLCLGRTLPRKNFFGLF